MAEKAFGDPVVVTHSEPRELHNALRPHIGPGHGVVLAASPVRPNGRVIHDVTRDSPRVPPVAVLVGSPDIPPEPARVPSPPRPRSEVVEELALATGDAPRAPVKRVA